MRIARALTIRDDAARMLDDCYSHAKHFGLLSVDIESRKCVGLRMRGVEKAPYWVKAYLEGYWRQITNGAYRNDLVFGAIIKGAFYSTHSSRDDYYEKHGLTARQWSELGDHAGTLGHYWRDSLKPYWIEPGMEARAA